MQQGHTVLRKAGWLALGGGLLLAAAIPVIAQSGPESLLPPGFGDPETSELPVEPAQPAPLAGPTPLLPGSGAAIALPPESALANAAQAEGEAAEDPEKYDMPAEGRRSLAQIGPLTATTGGVGPAAFGTVRGQALIGLMRASHAPFASRWGSILLRRVLLSGVATPPDVNGANLAAERAWLLLRMGEADAARLLVQSVDIANATPRLYDVAMQAYLATADPAGFCPLAPGAQAATDDPRWQLAAAICASFSGEQGTATSLLNQSRRRGKLIGIDYRLAEKTVGAGPNSRRSVRIEWEGVERLDSWRFGLATATNVEIPQPLYATAGDQVRAWEARAPAVPLARRLAGVATASRLGVFSSRALIGYYSQLGDPELAQGVPANLFETFRAAYAGPSIRARIDAMRSFWTRPAADGGAAGPGGVSYAALPALARAAAALPPTAEAGDDTPWLIAAMLAGGYDRNAAGWAQAVESMPGDGKARAWALLAVGLPDDRAGTGRGRVDTFVSADDSEEKVASRLLVAALYGLGRLGGDDAREIAGTLDMPLRSGSRWALALRNAAARREKGTVTLLAAVGLQARDWSKVPPAHLAEILTALRQVGLEPEARMIAAEAMTRV